MVVVTIATAVLLAALAGQANVTLRSLILLAATAPLITYLSLRVIVLPLPKSSRSPYRHLSWDCMDVVAVPLALAVPPAIAAVFVAGVSAGAYHFELHGPVPRNQLYAGAINGVATLVVGEIGLALRNSIGGATATAVGAALGIVVFEVITYAGHLMVVPRDQVDFLAIMRPAAVAIPVVVSLAMGLAVAYRQRDYVAGIVLALVPVLLIEVMRRFGQTTLDLEERQRERDDILRVVVEASEEQRASLAADVHDGALQSVLACGSLLSDLRDGSSPSADKEALTRAEDWLTRAAAELRAVVRQLVPQVLTELGLEGAIKHDASMLSRAPSQTVSVEYALRTRPNERTELVLYQVAHEALMNAAKHSGAEHVVVRVCADRDEIMLSVKDNGRGGAMENLRPEGHVGLAIARERVALAGGSFVIAEPVEGGTEVIARVSANLESGESTILRTARVASWWAAPLASGAVATDQQ